MIDTVVLTIPIKSGMIHGPDLFKPPLGIYKTQPAQNANAVLRATQNPTALDLRNGIYKPRLTFNARPQGNYVDYSLRIEFSAPKLLYGNNFDELEDSDFSRVIRALEIKLKMMEVHISAQELANAYVSAIHYSKNIIMEDGTTVTMILNELAKVNLNNHLDLSKTDFRTGHALRYHANYFELVFYDKLEDLRKNKISPKRAFEKDSGLQMNLFDPLIKKVPFEVLRMENRLGHRTKIKQILKKVGHNVIPTFRNLFSKNVSQKVLMSYWDDIDQNLFYSASTGKSTLDVTNFIRQTTPTLKLDQTLKMGGLLMLIEEIGIPHFRSYFGLVGSRSPPWYRLKKELNAYKGTQASSSYTPLFHIPNALKAFKTVKLANYNIVI